MQNTTHDNVILELTVRNHPGVMTHVCGLFARRAFNVEGILCLPIQDSDKSHIWLLVNDDQRLEQMISQIDKLEDVVKVQRNQSDPTMFNKIAVFFQQVIFSPGWDIYIRASLYSATQIIQSIYSSIEDNIDFLFISSGQFTSRPQIPGAVLIDFSKNSSSKFIKLLIHNHNLLFVICNAFVALSVVIRLKVSIIFVLSNDS